MKDLQFVRITIWGDEFNEWRERERDWGWEDVWKARGYVSWDVWRNTYVRELGLEDLQWELFSVSNPKQFFVDVWAGGYTGWKRYGKSGAEKNRISDLVKHFHFRENGKVKGILENPPYKTRMILLKSGDEFAVFEGMHRACALVYARKNDLPLDIAVEVAVAEINQKIFEKFVVGIHVGGGND